MKITILRNPSSARNAGRAAPETPDGVAVEELTELDALSGLLEKAKGRSSDLLVIDGGDGTIREVVSRLPEVFGDAPPILAIMPNGNTNLIARKHGGLPGYAALEDLASADRTGMSGKIKAAPVLRVDGLREQPVRGFIAGWGAYATGTRIAMEELSSRGGRQVAGAILSIIRRTFLGDEATALRSGIEAHIEPEGHPASTDKSFAGIATVLEGSLISGLNPFWGDGAGELRWIDIAAPPRRLFLAAPFIAMGRPRGWMTRAGYRSGRSAVLDLRLEGDLVVDGEVFQCAADRPLRLSAQERVKFLSL
ncbi:MAG: diacylglycerol kinase family protein [Pseudomonadota bacterium]